MARDFGTLVYGAVTLLGALYFVRRKWREQQKGRSISEFDLARWTLDFGAPKLNPPALDSKSGPRVVVVSASWGELVTLTPLIEALKRARPAMQLVFTVELREAIAGARALSDEEVLPQPFDFPLPVALWLARARPDLVILYEQFDLPMITSSLRARRVPFVVVRARVETSRGLGYKRRLNAPAFRRWQLRGLHAMLLQSPEQRDIMTPLAPAEAQLPIVGSIKFPRDKPRIAPATEAELRAWIGAGTAGAPLLVAGSTHQNEEAFVLDALAIVRRNCKGAAPAVVIAPRRLKRSEEIARLVGERGLRVSRRSQWNGSAPDGAVDVLLLDTLGELGAAYQFATGALVGGTFDGASHNVAEPLIWNVPVAYGPRRGNFEVEQRLCEDAGVGFRIETPAELAAHWTALLDSPDLRRELADKARALVEAQRGAFERTLQLLVTAVDEVTH